MSLFKQLWLAIIFWMTLAFLGSFLVSSLSAKSYLEAQLSLKNLDNANSLALSMGQSSGGTDTLDLFISTQFDTGHYQRISLNDPEGNLIAQRQDQRPIQDAPSWLMQLFPIQAQPGIAQVTQGWSQVGTLVLESHSRFAYRQMWDNTRQLFGYFIVAGLLSGLVGSFLLKWIISPLRTAVTQAKAIGNQQFISQREPKTREFRDLVRAMNQLSDKVRLTLRTEAAKLDQWRTQQQHDRVTGLLERSPFIARFNTLLRRDDASSGGILILIHICDLTDLNRSAGHQVMNRMLKEFGITLQQEAEAHMGSLTARLNGSDFIFTLPGFPSAEASTRHLLEKLDDVIERQMFDTEVRLLSVHCHYHAGDSATQLLEQLDKALCDGALPTSHTLPDVSAEQLEPWRETLSTALAERRFTLETFPVVNLRGHLLHKEAPARLIQQDGSKLNAGTFMPWLKQLNMDTQLDLVVTQLALQQLEQQGESIGINLSGSLLSDPAAQSELAALVRNHTHIAGHLWMELPEAGVYAHLDGFRRLCQLLKPYGCKIGVEHVGHEISHIGDFHDLGLDYIKVDGAFVQAIDTQVGNQVFLRGLCTMVHAIGLIAIAENVANEAEWKVLGELGIDAGTGPFFHLDDA